MSWIQDEVSKLIERNPNGCNLELGFGASGESVHCAHAMELIRTNWIAKEYRRQTGITPRLICFSDDQDGLRKIPEGMPIDYYKNYIGHSVSTIPYHNEDRSFAEHCNQSMIDLISDMNINVEFIRSYDFYRGGNMNSVLSLVYDNYQTLLNIILPTLGEDRRATYSPFMPIVNNKVLQVPVVLSGDYTVSFFHDGVDHAISILDGNVKLQWHFDWAMRWIALNIDFEFHGKDLLHSVDIGTKILKALNREPPQTVMVEMLLDENGEKISKSKGNGVTLNNWIKYGGYESLEYFAFANPRRAKKIGVSTIAQTFNNMIKDSTREITMENALFYMNTIDYPMDYSMLLTIVDTLDTNDVDIISDTTGIVVEQKFIDMVYSNYIDNIKAYKNYHVPTSNERDMLLEFVASLTSAQYDDGVAVQAMVYEIGKKYYGTDKADLLNWFKLIYSVLLGRDSGPRFGEFAWTIGLEKCANLIRAKL